MGAKRKDTPLGLMFPKVPAKKKKKCRHKSILATQKGQCYLCRKYTYTEEHHIFEGKNRQPSEAYGLKVYLCPVCHRTGPRAAHSPTDTETKERLHRIGQMAFERKCGSREEFIRIFGRSYLGGGEGIIISPGGRKQGREA